MNITMIGTGYVGLIAGLGFANFGNNVMCLDINEETISRLSQGECPIYEPGAEDLLKSNLKANRIQFTCDTKKAIEFGEIIFIAVGTPETDNGEADLGYVYNAARSIGNYIDSYKVVVTKSTVPVGTAKEIRSIIHDTIRNRKEDINFDVASNPEFLREGKAIGDFLNPDRIIIGIDSNLAKEKLNSIYKGFLRSNKPIIITSTNTAEMIKYASNAFLATKITFINEIANLCEKVDANVLEVAAAMGKDGRISPKFLHPGPGYGGSCFPKDTKALAKIGKTFGAPLTIIESVIKANEKQKEIAATKIIEKMPKGSVIALLGLSFKPDTDDIRESSAIYVTQKLLETKKYKLKLYDPQAMEESKKQLSDENIIWCQNAKEAIQGSDSVTIMTEWAEFRNLEADYLRKLMKGNVIFDFRNIFIKDEMIQAGFEYNGLGV